MSVNFVPNDCANVAAFANACGDLSWYDNASFEASATSSINAPKLIFACDAIALRPSCILMAVSLLTPPNLIKVSLMDAIPSDVWPVLAASIAISAPNFPLTFEPIADDTSFIDVAIVSALIPAICNCAAPYPTPPNPLPNNAVLDAA